MNTNQRQPSRRACLVSFIFFALVLACMAACDSGGDKSGQRRTDENDAPVGRWVRHASTDEADLGRITSIVFDPKDSQVIYAGTREGFVIKIEYHSGHVTNEFLAMPRKYQLAIRPEIAMAMGPPGIQYLESLSSSRSGILYAAFAGIMRSSNCGEDWEQVYKMPTVHSLAVDSSNASTVFAGTELEGVLRTTDDGQSWNKVLDFHYALVVTFDSQRHVFAGGGSGLWKSTDSGNTWKKLTDEFVTSLAISPVSPVEMYAGSANSTPGEDTLRYSGDGGQTWSVLRKGFAPDSGRGIIAPKLPIAVDPRRFSTLYVGTMGGGVFKSTDGGKTWHGLNEGLGDLDVFSLAVDPHDSSVLYAGTGSGQFWRIVQGE